MASESERTTDNIRRNAETHSEEKRHHAIFQAFCRVTWEEDINPPCAHHSQPAGGRRISTCPTTWIRTGVSPPKPPG